MYQNGNRFYWASEEGMLEWLLDRNNLSHGNNMVYSFKTGAHMKVDYSNRKLAFTVENVKLRPKYIAPVSSYRVGAYTPVKTKDALEKETGLNLGVGDEVYCYLESIPNMNQVKHHNLPRYNITFTLACSPFVTCKAFSVVVENDGEPLKPEEVVLFKAKISSAVYSAHEKQWILYLDGQSVKVVDTDCKKAEAEYDKWVEEVEPSQKKEEADDTAGKFYGFQGQELGWHKFKEVIDRGCVICGSPLDAVSEGIDRTCEFVDTDDVACESCCSNPTVLNMYGFNLEVSGL
jgi:hypothetical protein